MDEDSVVLTADEQLVLVGLLRMVARVDGQGTPEEGAAYRQALEDSLGPERPAQNESAPYREAPPPPFAPAVEDPRIAALEARADREIRNDAQLEALVLGVKRPVARETIYAAVADVAASDSIGFGEAKLLDWLADAWALEIREAPEST